MESLMIEEVKDLEEDANKFKNILLRLEKKNVSEDTRKAVEIAMTDVDNIIGDINKACESL